PTAHTRRRWPLNKRTAPLLKCLINAEVGDRQAERIDEDHGVGNLVAQDEVDLRDEGFALVFLAIAQAVVNLVEVDGGFERWVLQLVERHVLDPYLDLVGGSSQERLDGLVALALTDGGVGEAGVEEEQRLGVALL